jgi:hypothetical protein
LKAFQPIDSQKMMNDILQFTSTLIKESGGAVDWNRAENSFEALLPDHARRQLGLPDSLVTISGTIDTDEGTASIPIGFGTELLDRAIRMARDLGCTASVRMPALSGRKQSEPNPSDSFGFPNSTYQVTGSHDSWMDYWVWSFEVTADADERSEKVHHICISSLGAGCLELPELIFQRAIEWQPIEVKESEIQNQALENLFIAACDRLLRHSEEQLSEFKETITRHHVRDIRRIETYFQDLKSEMETEIEKRQLQGTELKIRREKIRQIEEEKTRKLAALNDKYKLRLTIHPVALLLARIPVKRCELLVKRRKGKRRISLVYNLLSKKFDPLTCEACGRDTYTLGFCDQSLHVLCESCQTLTLSKKTCPACRGNRPPSRVETVLKRLGIEKA